MAIFSDEADRKLFIGLMARFALKHGVRIVAWCLVINHYHIELKGTGDAMWKMIRDLERTYSRAYNRKTGQVGCAFQGPFKSIELPDSRAKAYVSRYIHGNSRDMGVAPEKYWWSSARFYLGEERIPRWMDLRPALEFFGGDRDAYAVYLAEIPRRRKKACVFDEAHGALIGHVTERCQQLMKAEPGAFGKFALGTLVSWKAHKEFGIPLRALADQFGFSTSRSVSTSIWRFERWLEGKEELRDRLWNC